MRILVVGAEGTVGKAAISDLSKRHEIISAGRSSGQIRVDLMDESSVLEMFKSVGRIDAVITTTGHSHFGPVSETTPELFRKGKWCHQPRSHSQRCKCGSREWRA
jgi:dTDP-4-dehydrorhamnose reductase